MIRTFALPITQDTPSEAQEREKRKKRKFFEDIGDSEACSKYPLIYESELRRQTRRKEILKNKTTMESLILAQDER